MAVLKDGFEAWVVGVFISDGEYFPKHDPKYLIVLPDGKPCVARGGDISTICGDRATLKDGRLCEYIRPR
jgi:hypothetical protein